MFTIDTHRARFLISCCGLLAAGALLVVGPAGAEPDPDPSPALSQDEQFLARLGEANIQVGENGTNNIETAHRLCRRFDAGASFDSLSAEMTGNIRRANPSARPSPFDHTTADVANFITAAVDIYCPDNRAKLPPE